MTEKQVFAMCDIVRETAFSLHSYLRHGHLEKVYENGLANRLQQRGLRVEQQMPIQVRDEDGTLLGDYFADLCVENVLIVELKACKAVAPEHTAQLLGYLRGCRMEHGMLINMGAPTFWVRKFVMSHERSEVDGRAHA